MEKDLASEFKAQTGKLLKSYEVTLAIIEDELGRTSTVKHRINTGNTAPIK